MKVNKKRTLISYIIIIIIGLLVNYFIKKTSIQISPLLSEKNTFTYVSILFGFAISIYIFAIPSLITILSKIKDDNEARDSLLNGSKEIKRDIYFILYAMLSIIIFSQLKLIQCPLNYDIESLKIPQTIFITAFIISTIAIIDLIKSLFNISDINLIIK